MPLMFLGNKLLFVGGALAMAEACCCGEFIEVECNSTTYRVPSAFRVNVGTLDGASLCGEEDVCAALSGVWTLPYASTSPSGSGIAVTYEGTPIVVCGRTFRNFLILYFCQSGFPGQVRMLHRFIYLAGGSNTAWDEYYPDSTNFLTFSDTLTNNASTGGTICQDGDTGVFVEAL